MRKLNPYKGVKSEEVLIPVPTAKLVETLQDDFSFSDITEALKSTLEIAMFDVSHNYTADMRSLLFTQYRLLQAFEKHKNDMLGYDERKLLEKILHEG